MRTGYELGYNVITIEDCAATVSEPAQYGAIEHDFPMFSHPMNHEEFVTEFEAVGLERSTFGVIGGYRP